MTGRKAKMLETSSRIATIISAIVAIVWISLDYKVFNWILPSPGNGKKTVSPKSDTPLISITNPRIKVRPIGPGLSISSPFTTAGTICCIVRDENYVEYLLTIPESLGNSIPEVGTTIIQPGNYDGGKAETDLIARVTESINIEHSPGAKNYATGVLARIEHGIDIYYDIPGVGELEGVAKYSYLKPGQEIRKFGRATELTSGQIISLNYYLEVDINIGGKVRRTGFGDLILATKFSKGGDGGAPVVDENNLLIGMVLAATPDHTIVIPIEPVLSQLSVTLAKDKTL